MTTDMERHGWGPGWPRCQGSKIKTLVRQDGMRIALRQELIPLFVYLFDETERRGYDLVPGWCWGYACRAIRGSITVGSNHSNGGAVDLNAPKNPMTNRLVTDMPAWMYLMWEAHMFRWGGRYRNRPDAMHYEFWGTPADAERIIRGLGKKPGLEIAPAAAIRGNELPIILHKGPNQGGPYTKSDLVEIYQELINKWIEMYRPVSSATGKRIMQLKVDGTYGPISGLYTSAWKAWMIQFQKDFGLSQWPDTSPYVGPITFGALQKFTS